ncbi:hypothetical protein ACLMMR_38585, partial [Streptomyces sp. NPDC000405]
AAAETNSFPLGGGFPTDRTVSVREALLSKHGISGAQAQAATQHIETLAATARSLGHDLPYLLQQGRARLRPGRPAATRR